VEGGAQLLNSFLAENLWDEANVEVAPIEIGNGIARQLWLVNRRAEKILMDTNGFIFITQKNVK
jgi:riboflavin biosynthesis pyrimidine reductase